MAKAQSPLLGYNTNVRHKGRVFHIQTEDSGIARPHVITHLFADGGRVLKTSKTSYAELVSADDVQVQVKKLMQDQHKAMFIALRDGQFDAHFDVPAAPPATPATPVPTPAPEVSDDAPTLNAPPPPQAVAPVAQREAFDLDVTHEDDGAIEIDESAFIEPTEPFSTVQEAAVPPMPEPLLEPSPEPLPVAPAPAVVPPPVRSSKISGPWVTAPRLPTPATPAASASSKPPPLRAPAVRTPPPALRAAATAAATPVRAPAPGAPSTSSPLTATRSSTGFGERLVTERSLDEVILAYLAEELDEPRGR